MIQTSTRAQIRRERNTDKYKVLQINETHPEGNRFTRRKIAKILRSRGVKKPAYKSGVNIPWWLIPKKVAEALKQ